MSGITNGIRDNSAESIEVAKSLGKYLVDGLSQGIREHIREAVDAAREMAREALEAAQDELDINSPSRKFYEVGEYVVDGFANSINDNIGVSKEAGKALGEASLKGMSLAVRKISDVVNGSMDFTPTIRPVVDLSNVKSSSRIINSILAQDKAYHINSAMSNTVGINQNGYGPASGNVYQFTQNNYSPKALSRIDIYRQTKNQFAAIERASMI